MHVAMRKLVTKMSHQMVRLWLVRHLNYVIVNRAKATLLNKWRLTVSPNVSPNLTPECDTFVLWESSLLKRLTKPCDSNPVMKWLVTKMSHQMVRLWLVRHLNYVIVNRAKATLLNKFCLTVSPNVSPNLTPECDTFVLWASSLLKRLTKPCDPNLVVKWLVSIMSHQNETK